MRQVYEKWSEEQVILVAVGAWDQASKYLDLGDVYLKVDLETTKRLEKRLPRKKPKSTKRAKILKVLTGSNKGPQVRASEESHLLLTRQNLLPC